MIDDFLEYNRARLYFYSPYCILRELNRDFVLEKTVFPQFMAKHPDHITFEVTVHGEKHYFILKYLKWDSDFLSIPNYKILGCLFKHRSFEILVSAVSHLKEDFFYKKTLNCYAEVPSEDLMMIQALTHCGFRMIESRLHHFHDHVENYHYERFPVRLARAEDISVLREVASNTRNIYDRLHADAYSNHAVADKYLATYVENAVKGFCDAVIVPDLKDMLPKAFMAMSLLKDDSGLLNCSLSRQQLSAVDPSFKGWYLKLASESVYYAQSKGARYMLVTTQTSNKAAFRSSEKQGFKLGSVSHIFSFANKIQ